MRWKSLPPPLLEGVSSEGGAGANTLSPRNLYPQRRWRFQDGDLEQKLILPGVRRQKKHASKEAPEGHLGRGVANLLKKQEKERRKCVQYADGLLEDRELQKELQKLAPSVYRVMTERFGKGGGKEDKEGVKGHQPIGHETTRDMKRITRAGRRAVESVRGVKRQKLDRQPAS